MSNEEAVKFDWFLPEYGTFADRSGIPQSHFNLEILIKQGLLHPNCPVLHLHVGVRKAHDFPELQAFFQKYRGEKLETLLQESFQLDFALLEKLIRAPDALKEEQETPSSVSSGNLQLGDSWNQDHLLGPDSTHPPSGSKGPDGQDSVDMVLTDSWSQEEALEEPPPPPDLIPSEAEANQMPGGGTEALVFNPELFGPEDLETPEPPPDEAEEEGATWVPEEAGAGWAEPEDSVALQDYDDRDPDYDEEPYKPPLKRSTGEWENSPPSSLPYLENLSEKSQNAFSQWEEFTRKVVSTKSLEDGVMVSDVYAKEWWLPDLPVFEGRYRFPQSLMNLAILIRKGVLQPHHYVRHLYKQPKLAGHYPELATRFQEVDSHFRPEYLLPQFPLNHPESGWSQELLDNPGGIVLIPAQASKRNLFVFASLLGMASGILILFPLALGQYLLQATTLYSLPWFPWKGEWPSLVRILAESLLLAQLTAHFVAWVHDRKEEELWGYPTGAILGGLVALSVGVGADLLSYDGWTVRQWIYVGGFGAFRLLVGCMAGIAVVLLNRVRAQDSTELTYQARMGKGGMAAVVLSTLLMVGSSGVIATASFHPPFSGMKQVAALGAVSEDPELNKPARTLHILSTSGAYETAQDGSKAYVVRGTIWNNMLSTSQDWFLTVVIQDPNGRIIDCAGLYNGVQVPMESTAGRWTKSFLLEEHWNKINDPRNVLQPDQKRMFTAHFPHAPQGVKKFNVKLGEP